MWGVVGSWPFVVAVLVAVALMLAVSWNRAGRGPGNFFIAITLFVVTGLASVVMMVIPLTVDGTTCNNRATPFGVNHDDLDSATTAELENEGVSVPLHACRDGLRSRYLLTLGGFVLVNVGGVVLLVRRRRAMST